MKIRRDFTPTHWVAIFSENGLLMEIAISPQAKTFGLGNVLGTVPHGTLIIYSQGSIVFYRVM